MKKCVADAIMKEFGGKTLEEALGSDAVSQIMMDDGAQPAFCLNCGAKAPEDMEPDAVNEPCFQCGKKTISSLTMIMLSM